MSKITLKSFPIGTPKTPKATDRIPWNLQQYFRFARKNQAKADALSHAAENYGGGIRRLHSLWDQAIKEEAVLITQTAGRIVASNPFARRDPTAPLGYTMWGTAYDRIEQVKTFNIDQCLMALLLEKKGETLANTVKQALQRRYRKLTKNSEKGKAKGWIPCEEGLPDDDTTVLICNPSWDGDPVTLGFHSEGEWHDSGGMSWSSDITGFAQPSHWIHLPDPPTS